MFLRKSQQYFLESWILSKIQHLDFTNKDKNWEV